MLHSFTPVCIYDYKVESMANITIFA